MASVPPIAPVARLPHADVLFPQAVSFGTIAGPSWTVDVTQLPVTNRERRVGTAVYPLYQYDLALNVRTDQEVAQIMRFWNARRGPLQSFRILDVTDFSTAFDLIGDPAALDQMLGIGDGARTRWPLWRAYDDDGGDGSNATWRPILCPVVDTILVAVDGMPEPAGWAWDNATREIVFDDPPGAGIALAWGGLYHVPVRFTPARLGVSIDDDLVRSIDQLGAIEVREII